jgi:hypothetical protein
MSATLFGTEVNYGLMALRKEFDLPLKGVGNYTAEDTDSPLLKRHVRELQSMGYKSLLLIGEGRNIDNTRNGMNALVYWKIEEKSKAPKKRTLFNLFGLLPEEPHAKS